jgi:oxygen-independent coproporphyrinogen-3 oxidase
MSLGIYIQVPFCQTKCTYCNFHTGPAARSMYAPYAHAVEREIRERASAWERQSPDWRGCAGTVDPQQFPTGAGAADSADTIYLGGGTPSLLDPADLAGIVATARECFAVVNGEITLEADPETITAEKAAAWLAMGINRISMGAQSFHDVELAAAGRMHRRADIFTAVELLRAAGFANVSLDLIAGLPHQTADSWHDSLGALLRLRPEHLSIYLLEIDEGSRLGRESLAGGSRYGAAAIPDDDTMAGFYEGACEELAAAGYEHYEISNWALPGFRSRHNLKYWRREPYLGFGAGAHSFDGRWRWANVHDPAAYVAAIEQARSPTKQREEVSRAQALEEEMFLGLRQLEGIDLARIEQEYETSLAPRIAELQAQGLVERQGTLVRLAPGKLTVSNEVFVALLD